MFNNTLIRRASHFTLFVILLALGPLLAGCAARATPTAIPTPEPASKAASAPAAESASPLVVADFDNCTNTNNLGGAMGAAYNPPDSLKESYPQEPERGCVARLEYHISGWSGFWLKLQGADLRPYSKLVFDIRADPQPGIPRQAKLELKRPGEVSILHISDIGTGWKTISAELSSFGYAGYGKPVSSWQDMEELVVTFESAKSGPQGVVFIDDVTFVR